jgi:mannosylglycerate hydrolase
MRLPHIRPSGADTVAVVVPHTHWDREWYAPFETMRFHLVRFLDELIEVLEATPDLVFVLDGQVVMLEDYLEIRPGQRSRLKALGAAGRLRLGPWYVQPDEFHVSGEALVRNLLIGCRVAGEFGGAMREGYLPDTFGHVHQLPQILRGFGIETFYAMRGFGASAEEAGDEFWWEALDGSRVRAMWLRESYSNAAVLAPDPDRMSLHHAALVRYDTLHELLDRLAARSPTGVLVLLNGGDHMRIQAGAADLVRALDASVDASVHLGGLEEVHALLRQRGSPQAVLRGEQRHGLRHDVFDGIGSTRTPLKAHHERTAALVAGLAERLDALATLVDGRGNTDALHHAWRELIKNHAHDSICGCSVDPVHDEMHTRLAKIEQLASCVADDALARIAAATAPATASGGLPVVAVNPSPFPRSGAVEASVVPDLDAPLGVRQFGWRQGAGVDWTRYRLLDESGRQVPFTVRPAEGVSVVDVLNRRKEVRTDHLRFVARDVPALGVAQYRLVRDHHTAGVDDQRGGHARPANDVLEAEFAPDGTLSLTHLPTGRTFAGLLELLDGGDAGDEYGFGPLPDDVPVSSRDCRWIIDRRGDDGMVATTTLRLPRGLRPDRRARSDDLVDVPVSLAVRIDPFAEHVEVRVTTDNRAMDHRMRLRFDTGVHATESLAESAFGIMRRPVDGTEQTDGWHERPSGVHALRRFVAVADDTGGLQVLTEGLHEYALDADGRLDVTLLRAVGWLSRTDHPRRAHKIGPQLETPGAQCLGEHTFRIALRPFGPGEGPGALYRAAERFCVPLRAHVVQTNPQRMSHAGATPLGLQIDPAAVVLSAVKVAEDRDGVVVRIFNSDDEPRVASLTSRTVIVAARLCDLEERNAVPLELAGDGSVRIPLAAGGIATVRIQTGIGPIEQEGASDGPVV